LSDCKEVTIETQEQPEVVIPVHDTKDFVKPD